jgi:hypothetical protein
MTMNLQRLQRQIAFGVPKEVGHSERPRFSKNQGIEESGAERFTKLATSKASKSTSPEFNPCVPLNGLNRIAIR